MLSEVPDGWQQVPLSELLEVMRNGFSCKQEKSQLEGYVPVSRIETISTGSIDASRVGYVPYEEKLERYKIEKGDILFSHINSVEHIAKIAFAEEAQNFFHAMNLLLLRADSTKIIPYYLAEVLRWRRTRSYFREHCKRAVNQVSLNQKNIGGYELSLPPLREQTRIAEILSSVDASIQATQAVIEQAERVKRGLMEELLTGGLGSEAIERGEVPEMWACRPLEELLELSTPGFWGKPEGDDDVTIRVLRATNFTSAGINYETAAPRSFPRKKVEQKSLIKGDVLLERSGGSPSQPVGRVRRFDREGGFSLSNFFQLLRADEACVDSLFLFYMLDDFYLKGNTEVLQKATTGIRNLAFKEYLATPFPVPPLNEQHRIAEILSDTDSFISKQKTTIEQQNRTKRGVMDDLLTGKVRTV